MGGSVFKAARALLGLSVHAMSAASGITVGAIRNLEAGLAQTKSQATLEEYLATRGIAFDGSAMSIEVTADPEDIGEVGRIFAAARTLAGLNQAELAATAAVSLRTVNNLETGRSAVLGSVKDSIVKALRVHDVSIAPNRDRGPNAWRIVVTDTLGEGEPRDTDMNGGEAVGTEPGALITERLDRVGLYRVDIEVRGTEPKVRRELLLPQTTTFFDLHAIIQIAFGWRRSHLHEFRCGVRIGPVGLPDSPNYVDERLVSLNDVASDKESFVYEYDFGDSWIHDVRIIESVAVEAEDRPSRPILVGGEGAHVPEDAGGIFRWNELASNLLAGRVDPELADWLEYSGYGRAYRPTSFDGATVEANLQATKFDIPSTWTAAFERRRAIEARTHKLPTDYPEPPRAPRYSTSSIKIVSVTDFPSDSRRRVPRDEPQGSTSVPTRTETGFAEVRGYVGSLATLLEICPDVTDFEGTPTEIVWSDGKRQGKFLPDFSISIAGRTTFLHVCFDEEEYEFCLKLRKAGVAMRVVGNRIMDIAAMETIDEMRHWRDLEGVPGKSMLDIIEREGGKKGLPMQKAVRLLLAEGYGRQEGVIGGTPERRTALRIAAAAMRGEIGIDLSKPFQTTTVGLPSLTMQTGSFDRLARPFEL